MGDEADCSPPREDVGANIEEVLGNNVRGLRGDLW